MPDIPKTIEQEIELDKKSKPYRGHPTVTVRQFCKLDYQAQRLIDRQAEEMQGGVRQWIAATRTKAAHWLMKEGEYWKEEPS